MISALRDWTAPSSTAGGRTRAGKMLLHLGMACAALAFASWWTSRTILDSTRTARMTAAALDNSAFRHFVAEQIASVTSGAAGPAGVATAPDRQALTGQIEAVLSRTDIRDKLEAFVADAHDELIGRSSKPAVLDQPTMAAIVTAALPNLPPGELAKLHPVSFDVPHVGVLAASRRTLVHLWLYLIGAVAFVAAAFLVGTDRRATVKLVGQWLLGLSVGHLVVLWIVPVLIVPHVTRSPWAGLVAAVARALGAGVVSGLVLAAAAGLALLLADRFIPPVTTAPATT